MEENKNIECPKFTIYTEDFCIKFGDCKDNTNCCCNYCNGFQDLFNWIKNKKRKPFF